MLKVVVVGHRVPNPLSIEFPDNPIYAKQALQLYNYTRVFDEKSNTLIDHDEFFRINNKLEGRFSVWEMYLASGLILSSHLKRDNHDVMLFNTIDSSNEVSFIEEVNKFKADILIFSTTFILTKKQFIESIEFFKKEFPDIFILAGGQFVFTSLLDLNEAAQSDWLLETGCDGIVNDTQGEAALLKFCKNFPDNLNAVSNLIWRDRSSNATVNKRSAEDNDINSTPVDFNFVPEGVTAHIRTARSCGFKCAFCTYPSVAGPLSLMDLNNALSTLRHAKEKGVGQIIFADDTFNVPKDRFEEFLDIIIAEDLNIPWYSFLRCQYINQRIVKKMKKSGCQAVFLGIESGSDAILKNMKKGSIANFYLRGIEWLRSEGIKTVGAFVIGFPGETIETANITRNFIETAGLDYYFLQPFFYLHHAPIHNQATKYNLSGEGLFWSHNTMDWRQSTDLINKYFYEIENPIFLNPDYTLWELAYFRSKGLSVDAFNEHRVLINRLTRDQMDKFSIIPTAATERDAAFGKLAQVS